MDNQHRSPKCPFNMTIGDDAIDVSSFLLTKIAEDVAPTSSGIQTFRAMSRYTVALPPNCNPAVRDKFVDSDTLNDLTNRGVLNWSQFIMKLYPLKTPGDGNCLLHAASIAMWGLLDQTLLLRRLLHFSLCEETRKSGSIEQRWKESQLRRSTLIENTLSMHYSSEFQNNFNSIVEAVADRSRADVAGISVEYLEPIHVFTLANVLKRPIVVVADQQVITLTGNQLEENAFSGIYLPLLVPAEQCVKYPLVLAFSMYHFTPLIGEIDTEKCLNYCIPLVYDRSMQPLPIRFLVAAEETQSRQLLDSYLHVSKMQEVGSGGGNPITIPVALLHHATVPGLNLMDEYVKQALASVSGSRGVFNSPVVTPVTPSYQDNRVSPVHAANQRQGRDAPLMSVVNKRCQFPDCDNFCSRYLLPLPFCYEHAFRDDTRIEQQQEQQHYSEYRSGSLPSELRSQPDRQRCVVANCKFHVPPGEGSYCHMHRGLAHPPPLHQQQQQGRKNQRKLCLQCHENRGKHQYSGVCSHCYYRNVYGTNLPARQLAVPQTREPQPQSPPQAGQQREQEQIIVPAVENCLNEGCPRMAGTTDMAGLCAQCYAAAMTEQQRTDMRHARHTQAPVSPPRAAILCAAHGCYRLAESHQDYCQQHQRQLQAQHQPTTAVIIQGAAAAAAPTTAGNKQQATPADTRQQQRAAARQPPAYAATEFRRQLSSIQPCRTPACPNDGIWELSGLCITCNADRDRTNAAASAGAMAPGTAEAQVQTSLTVSIPPVVTSTNGIAAPADQSASAQQREPEGTIKAIFVDSLRAVEQQSRNGAQRCHRTGCTNFGNSQRRGYCSSCYKQMQQLA